MLRSEKIEFVSDLTKKIGNSQSIILADFCGLTVAEVSELRTQLRAKGVEFRVVKNRLGKRALGDAGCESLDEFLVGNTAWAFGVQDAVDPAKVLSDFAKEHEKLVLKGGMLESKKIDLDTVKQLAKMPGRLELLSMVAGGLKQPGAKLAIAMNQSLTKIAYAFQALAEKKQNEGEAAA